MNIPDQLQYTKDHEWVKVDGNIAMIGITDYAQEHMGDVVYVELPEEGEMVGKGDSFAVVESVKSANDVYTPVSGKVVEINSPLTDGPEIVNEDCYEEGWIAKVELSDKAELDGLMDATAYEAFVKEAQG